MGVSTVLSSGSELLAIGVAVGRLRAGNLHAGIIFRRDDDSDNLAIVHCAWHHNIQTNPIRADFRCEATDDAVYLCIAPHVAFEDLMAIAGWCRAITDLGLDVAYGISYDPNGRLVIDDEHIRFESPEGKTWLNCSTFVLTIFATAGVPLIDPTGWPVRPDEDQKWRRILLWALRQDKKMTDAHYETIKQDIKGAYIRPEETAGAALSDSLPVDFPRCDPLARQVLRLIGGDEPPAPDGAEAPRSPDDLAGPERPGEPRISSP